MAVVTAVDGSVRLRNNTTFLFLASYFYEKVLAVKTVTCTSYSPMSRVDM